MEWNCWSVKERPAIKCKCFHLEIRDRHAARIMCADIGRCTHPTHFILCYDSRNHNYGRSAALFYNCQNIRVLHYAWHNSAWVYLCLRGFVCFCGLWLIQTHYAQISRLHVWILLCLTELDGVHVGSRATLSFMQQAFAHYCLCGRRKNPAINTDQSPALRFLAQRLV